MNKIIITIVSIAVLACIIIAVVFLVNPNTNTGNTDIGTIPIGNIKFDHGSLQAELKKPLPSITNSAIAYRVNNPVVEQNYIKHLTDQFGFKGKVSPVTGPEGQTIINDGNKRLEIFKDGGFLYIDPKVFSNSVPTNLPSKDQAIKIAENFVARNNLFYVDTNSVIVNPNTQGVYYPQNNTTIKQIQSWAVGFGTIINGSKVVGPGAGIGIYIGDNGEIIMVNLIWRDATPYKIANLKSTDRALSDLTAGQGEVSKASDNGNKVVINKASIGYYMDTGLVDQKYIKPVYIFDGDMYNGNTLVQSNGFRAYVPAIENDNDLHSDI